MVESSDEPRSMKDPVSRFTYVVSAEHASRSVPSSLADLGLTAEILSSHVAWDPGVDVVATQLARALEAPLFLGQQSRLVADLNRSPGSREVVPEVAFGVLIPGNQGLSAAERQERELIYHAPYWRQVAATVQARLACGDGRQPVLHLSVHSFTEELGGERRDVDLGVLFDPAHPLEQHVAAVFIRELVQAGFDARENQPYDGRADALVTALRARYPVDAYAGVEIEISQRLLQELDRIAPAIVQGVRALG